MYQGMCYGGPMSGQEGASRFEKGFVLIDKPNRLVWVYDRDAETGSFHARQEEPYDEEKHMHAAEGVNYDVRALDRGR